MKKKNLLLSFLIIAGMAAFAQQSSSVAQIPANVQNTLHTFYPNATNVTWEQDRGYFIPVFTNNNAQTKLLIDLKGSRIQTSVQIATTALPAATRTFISGTFPGETITDSEQLTMINNSMRYEVVVGGNKDLIFDASGNYLKAVNGPLKQ